MAVGVVQYAKNNYGNNAVHSGTISIGAAQGWATPTAGNTIVLQFFGTSPTWPAGFTQRLNTAGPGPLNAIATKVSAGTETTLTVTMTPDSAIIAMIAIEVENGTYTSIAANSSAPTTSLAFPSITPTAGTEAFLLGGSVWTDAYNNDTDPTNYTPVVPGGGEVGNTGTNSARIQAWYRSIPSASGSYTGTASCVNNVYFATWHMLFAASSPPPPGSPVANFTGTPRTGAATLNVVFTDTSTNTPTSWLWDFGDSGTSTSQNPSHNYTTPGTYTVSLTATNATGSDDEVKVGYIVVSGPAEPGGVVEWDDEFVDVTGDIAEWTITRGASPELTGGSQPGSATIRLINRSDKYNPENTGGPYYGLLRDGPRVWIGVNEDGTVTPDPDKDVYGLHAGRITDFSLLPQPGAEVAPYAEVVTEDPLGWMSRQKVRLVDSTTRSQAELRAEVLDALGEIDPVLPAEPTTLPLSRADGLALNILDAINAANGTRHFAKPADNSTEWYHYTAVRRVDRLDGVADASVDAGAEHVTGTSGWRISADGVINQQKASVEPIVFPGRVLVWQPDALPLVVTGTQIIWAEFSDYVGDPLADVDYTGSALTATLDAFGDTAKLTLASAGTSSITSLDITGYLVQRGSTESVVIDDAVSQADSRGVRAGPDLTGDYLGTLSTAKGFAQHIVWRFGNPKYRPTMVVENWFPEMFDLDLFDRISFTSSELSITDRIFEIVGLTLHCDLAALDADGNPVVHHTVTYVLQESRVQTPTQWFTTDVSTSDGPDLLAF